MRVLLGKRNPHYTTPTSIKGSIIFVLLSLFIFFVPILVILKAVQTRAEQRVEDDAYTLRAIVQTGPRKRALPSQYLLQQLGISRESELNIYALDLDKLKRRLLAHPIISEAIVDIIPPDTLYVDYTIRNPKAILGNWSNTAVDAEQKFFPLYPFYTPKSLPKVYLPERQEVKWGIQGECEELEIALNLIKEWEENLHQRGLRIEHVDVSDVYSENFGSREIVLNIEDVAKGRFFYVRLPSQEKRELKNFLLFIDYKKELLDETSILDMRLENTAYLKVKKSFS